MVKIDELPKIELQVWDTAGQERYRSVGKQYYRYSDGCLLVIDLSAKSKANEMESWIKNYQEASNNPDNIIIIANKKDLERNEETLISAKKICEKYNLELCETSAASGEGVENAFDKICRLIVKNNEITLNKSTSEESYVAKKTIHVRMRTTEKISISKKKSCC